MNRDTLQRRAETAFWGCLACAQPWLVAGSRWAVYWLVIAVAAWLVARLNESLDSQTDFVQRAFRWLTNIKG